MTKHRFLAQFAFASSFALLLTSAVRADRISIMDVGLPTVVAGTNPPQTRAPTPLDFNSVPTIQMNVGETKTLHLWMQLERTTAYNYDSVAWSIDSSNGAVARITDHTVDQFAGAQNPRWNSMTEGVEGAAGSTDWLTNAYAFKFDRPGIGVGEGIFNVYPYDRGRDDQSGAFYLGSFTFTATQNGRTGLYLRVGDFKIVEGSVTAPSPPIKFGANNDTYGGWDIGAGDAITADLALADAIIQVGDVGPTGPTVDFETHDGTNLTGDVVFNAVGHRFINMPNNASAGRINIVNFPGDGSGNLPLFFDLVNGANAQQLVNDLNAGANGAFTAALANYDAPNTAGGTSTADIVITYTGFGVGDDAFIDFDFGAGNNVAAVGVPEPSSIALVGMSLVGLVGYGIRRRRSA